jgi:hypothetical protein
MAILAECDGKTVSRKHETHASRAEVSAIVSECARMAPIASAWCGYVVPPETFWVTAACEGGWHNLNRDQVVDPWHRSTGYVAMRPSCYTKFSRRSAQQFISRAGLDLDEWSVDVCGHNRGHPLQQVRVYFSAWAYYLRQEGGAVDRVASIWRYGYPTEPSYARRNREVWQRVFGTYPEGGQLRIR